MIGRNPSFTMHSKIRLVTGGRIVTWLLIIALLPAYTTTSNLRPTANVSLRDVVRVGDDVTCTLKDGTTRTLAVTEVHPERLVGRNASIASADVGQLEIERFSAGKTLLLCGLVVVAIGGVAAVGNTAVALGP